LTNKESESENNEQELLDEVEQTMDHNSLQSKMKNKKSKIESLIQENEEISKELETTKQRNQDLLNKSQPDGKQKQSVKFKKESQEFKITSGGKKVIRKGDSGIKRQKTGYNVKTKQIMDKNNKLDEEIERIKQEVDSVTNNKNKRDVGRVESGNSEINHKALPDWDSRTGIPRSNTSKDLGTVIIDEAEIADSLSELRLMLQVFEGNSCKFLFKDKYLISIDDSIQAFHDKLKLSQDLSTKLAYYLVDPQGKGKLGNKVFTLNRRDFQDRIENLVGNYRKYDNKETSKLIESFFNSSDNDAFRSRFLNEMLDLVHVGNITKNEFEKTMGSIPIDINMKSLLISLLRESNSLYNISGESIKGFVDLIKKEEKNFPKSISMRSIRDASPSKYEQYVSMHKQATEEVKSTPEDLNVNKNFFVKLADFMFNNDLTLYQIIHLKIYDKMFNGREYELISGKAFFKLLSERGFNVIEREKKAIANLLKNSYLIDVIEVQKISKILAELDIKEDIPIPSKNFDYHHLTAPDIRLVNKIVEHMEDKEIGDIEDLIGLDRISIIEVVGSNKREDIQIIDANDFLQCLIEKNIIDDDELNEGLQMFFAISIENIDKLMIRKIKK
jgi:hypothetical protein